MVLGVRNDTVTPTLTESSSALPVDRSRENAPAQPSQEQTFERTAGSPDSSGCPAPGAGAAMTAPSCQGATKTRVVAAKHPWGDLSKEQLCEEAGKQAKRLVQGTPAKSIMAELTRAHGKDAAGWIGMLMLHDAQLEGARLDADTVKLLGFYQAHDFANSAHARGSSAHVVPARPSDKGRTGAIAEKTVQYLEKTLADPKQWQRVFEGSQVTVDAANPRKFTFAPQKALGVLTLATVDIELQDVERSKDGGDSRMPVRLTGTFATNRQGATRWEYHRFPNGAVVVRSAWDDVGFHPDGAMVKLFGPEKAFATHFDWDANRGYMRTVDLRRSAAPKAWTVPLGPGAMALSSFFSIVNTSSLVGLPAIVADARAHLDAEFPAR